MKEGGPLSEALMWILIVSQLVLGLAGVYWSNHSVRKMRRMTPRPGLLMTCRNCGWVGITDVHCVYDDAHLDDPDWLFCTVYCWGDYTFKGAPDGDPGNV